MWALDICVVIQVEWNFAWASGWDLDLMPSFERGMFEMMVVKCIICFPYSCTWRPSCAVLKLQCMYNSIALLWLYCGMTILWTNTHSWKQVWVHCVCLKTVSGESRQLKRLLSIMKMMVWCFASNAHKVMTALIVVLSLECCCGAFSLQFHCYVCLRMLGLWSTEVKVSKAEIDLWFTIVALEIPNSWILRKKTNWIRKVTSFEQCCVPLGYK
jgi:hypothetical protein